MTSKLEDEILKTLYKLEKETLNFIHNCDYETPILIGYYSQAQAYRMAAVIVSEAFKNERKVYVPKPNKQVIGRLLKREGAVKDEKIPF